MIGATASAVTVVRAIARLFGASSPNTTCSSVMIRKASAPASGMLAMWVSSPSRGSSRLWNARSPATPSPRLEIVMPSWHAAR